jgi:hypothetical protein
MSLAEFQAALGRVYVDECMRRLLSLDPAAALAGYRLTEEERRALTGIDRRQLERFCRGLRIKKLHKVQWPYAASFRLCQARCEECFSRFYSLRPSTPGGHPGDYAYDFGVFLEQSLLADPIPGEPFMPDLVRFEREYELARRKATGLAAAEDTSSGIRLDQLELTGTSRPVLRADVSVHRFATDVIKLNAALRAGGTAGTPEPSPGYIAFKAASNMNSPGLFLLPPRLGRVLLGCDGVRDINQMARSAAARTGYIPDSVPDLLSALRRFARLGLTACP